MDWKKVIVITIVLGLFFQFIGTLAYSYAYKGDSPWTPFQVERCRASSGAALTTACEKLYIIGVPPYWYGGNKAYAPMQGLSAIGLLQNLILWHGLAFIIALLLSKKRKMSQV